MKKTSLIAIACLALLYSCKKGTQQPTPVIVKTWISGKWKRTLYQDTTFDRSNGYTVTPNSEANELNFIDTNKVTQSLTGTQEYIYSLSKGTIDFGNGRLFKITKISDVKIKLDWFYYATGINVSKIAWVDIYTKE